MTHLTTTDSEFASPLLTSKKETAESRRFSEGFSANQMQLQGLASYPQKQDMGFIPVLGPRFTQLPDFNDYPGPRGWLGLFLGTPHTRPGPD